MADKTSRNYIKRPRDQPLRRGKACSMCRSLKIRCDGNKPVCGPCARASRERCEYVEILSRTQELEQTMERLENHLRRLEGTTSSVFLDNPYHDITDTDSVTSSDNLSASESGHLEQEPPLHVIQSLLSAVISRGFSVGFFLDAERLQYSALLPQPLGHASRPSPALLNSVYLLGFQLTSSDGTYQAVFLKQALQYAMSEVSSQQDPDRGLQLLQALVLLANYFFMTNQFVSAEYYANCAVSLSLSLNLHKTLSSRQAADSSSSMDTIEQIERINGFWATFCTERLIQVSANKTSNNFGWLATPSSEIDTPFPRDSPRDKSVALTPCLSTINSFFLAPVGSTDSVDQYVKAIILFHRAVYLSQRSISDMNLQERATYNSSCAALGHVIDVFLQALTFFSCGRQPSPNIQLDILSRALATCARMRIHQIFASLEPLAGSEVVNCAITILRFFSVPDSSGVHSIVGILCRFAIDVLARETISSGNEESKLFFSNILTETITCLATFSDSHPFIAYQLAKIKSIWPV